MIDEILSGSPQFPAHLHRHVLQLYVIRHRRAPVSPTEQRRAVYEYLTRGLRNRGGKARVHVSAELAAWLTGEDEVVRGWGPLPRLAGVVHQFTGELKKRYDLGTERDYQAFACYLALDLQSTLQWPEEIVGETLRQALWEPAPGILARSRVGVTRALHHIRRRAERMRNLDLAKAEDLSQLLLAVLSDIDEGKIPSYALSPGQYEYLMRPVDRPRSELPLSGLLHHLLIERGVVQERALARADVAATLRREIPKLLRRVRLPACLRDAHAEHLAHAPTLAIVPQVPAPAPMVTVVGPLSHGSGLGAAARACVEAFQSARIPVEVLDLKASWGRNDESAGCGTTARVRGDINVIHFNPDVLIENLSRFGLEQFERTYNIGYFVWETSQASVAHRLGADLVDEVWVPTEYCRQIFERVTDKPIVVVRTPVPRIADISWATRRYFGLDPGPFTFVFTFDGASRFTRKNPIAVAEAFQRAFPSQGDVRLVLKTQNTEHLHPPDERMYAEIRRRARADRRIVVIDESFSSNEVHGLISVCDCYVSLHRSEGFGYGMAEAMELEVPVIATGYSGNADFTTDETSYPVHYRLVPVRSDEFVYDEAGPEWAEPDIDHAAQRMLEVIADLGRSARTGRAKRLVDTQYHVEAVGRTYRQRIEAIRSGHGAVADALNAGVA